MRERVRRLVYQCVVLGALVGCALAIAGNTQANLARLGVHSSADFLLDRAGFNIGQRFIQYDPDATILRALGVACLNTLSLCVLAIVVATVVGTLIGVARLSRSWPLRALATAFVELVRNAPLLLQIFFWYFVVLRTLPDVGASIELTGAVYLNNRGLFLPVPQLDWGRATTYALLAVLFGSPWLILRLTRRLRERSGKQVHPFVLAAALVATLWLILQQFAADGWSVPQPGRFSLSGGLVLVPEFLALLLALSLYNASYIAEIVRSALLSVSRGQQEAAQALGLSRARTLQLVLLPQALRTMAPPLTTVYQNVLKSSSLGAAIAYPEIASVLLGTVNNLVGQPVVVMTITLLLYLGFSTLIAAAMHLFVWRKARWP
jgi:general L-amino acid transport system permease protein